MRVKLLDKTHIKCNKCGRHFTVGEVVELTHGWDDLLIWCLTCR